MEKPQLVLLVFGLLAAEWPPAAALPNGAPLGACGSMAPQHNNISPQPGPNPHSIQTQNLKPNVQVHLDGPFYKGILLEARYPNGTTAVGTWQTAPADTKTIRSDCCSEQSSLLAELEIRNNLCWLFRIFDEPVWICCCCHVHGSRVSCILSSNTIVCKLHLGFFFTNVFCSSNYCIV
ncbi:uncharacterized protein LOC119977475 isoform X2 [Scyliorhinus canicula]|uniref:uncharacterized protein LOC119977475 isoform X2 n=1 Tax=Scyliorhinus canicula TaxID=7830 RepID=UPI0018F35701|nr:uncharacterized protein LOC119977475 isoform X2 [Scyliorhinus canicula]